MTPTDSSQSASGSTHAETPATAPSEEEARSLSAHIAILGGGEAGLTVLEALAETDLLSEVALVEPSTHHYDQPAWVRVGTEGVAKEDTRSSEVFQVPPGVTWIQERVDGIDPERRTVTTSSDTKIQYDYLVVALGTTVRWDRIRDLEESLGSYGICSVYGYEQAERTWEMIRAFEGGQALFTAPSTPHKGGGAPLAILRRAEALWRETGVRDRTELFYTTAASSEAFEENNELDTEEADIHVYTGYDLIDVRPEQREAVFRVTKGQSQSRDVLAYDLLHVVPPMRPPGVVEESELAYRDGPMRGYLEVDPETLRHPRFDTVFGVGDVLGLEGVKTGERARKQAAAVARTLRRIAGE
jgi:sulfide:quinone oxidoreductase